MSSRYHEPKNVLMLNFIVVAEDGEPVLDAKELEEVRWFAFEDALEAIRKDSVAEAFLKSAVNEIKKIIKQSF